MNDRKHDEEILLEHPLSIEALIVTSLRNASFIASKSIFSFWLLRLLNTGFVDLK